MLNTKLGQVLNSWSPDKRKRFNRFVASPYFNSQKILSRVWTIWDTFLLSKGKNLSEEAFYKKLYRDKNFDQNQLRKLNTALLKLAEEFLAIEAFRAEEGMRELMLLKELNKQKHQPQYGHYEKQAKKKIEAPPASFSKLSSKHLMLHEHMAFMNYHQKQYDVNYIKDSAMALDEYYFAYRLMYAFHAFTMGRMLKEEVEGFDIATLMPYLEERLDDMHFLTRTMYYLYKLSAPGTAGSEAFEKLKGVFLSRSAQMDESIQDQVYASLMNYCVNKVNLGNPEFRNSIFELQNTTLQLRSIQGDNFFTPREFNNLISNGLALKKFDWALQILESYGEKIHPDHREITLAFCQGRIAFFRGKFADARKMFNRLILNQKKPDDHYMDIYIRMHALQASYELEDWEEIENRVDTYKQYVTRHGRLGEGPKSRNIGFYKALKKLSRAKGSDHDKLNTLKEELAEGPKVISKNWLLEKIDEKLNSSTR